MRIGFVLGLGLLFGAQARAVTFGAGTFLDSGAFLRREGGGDELRRALDGVLLVGARATAFLITPDGWAVTARHVVQDLYIGPVSDCSRLPLFFRHEATQDGSTPQSARLRCLEIAVSEYNDDFVLFRVAVPEGMRELPYAPIEAEAEAVREGMDVIVAGHPHARDFSTATKKAAKGPVVLHAPEDPQLPHFLHLVDTEGGNSGSPALTEDGRVVGLHIRGVPHYSAGVDALVNGRRERIHRFNVAVSMAYLARKYIQPRLGRIPGDP